MGDSSVFSNCSMLTETFTMRALPAGHYELRLRPYGSGGSYDLRVICDATEISSEPTMDLSSDPTMGPTTHPTAEPTRTPTMARLSARRTTPAPTAPMPNVQPTTAPIIPSTHETAPVSGASTVSLIAQHENELLLFLLATNFALLVYLCKARALAGDSCRKKQYTQTVQDSDFAEEDEEEDTDVGQAQEKEELL